MAEAEHRIEEGMKRAAPKLPGEEEIRSSAETISDQARRHQHAADEIQSREH